MAQPTHPSQNSRTDTPQRQYPGVRGNPEQAEEFINEYEPTDDPAEGSREAAELSPQAADMMRKRGDVPVGPSEHDKKVPPEVAQGD